VGAVKEFALYTAARLGVFLACYAVVLGLVTLLGGRDQAAGVLPLVVAVRASAALSTYLLRGLRDRFAARVQARADRIVASQDDHA
jgi:hypothetical protein